MNWSPNYFSRQKIEVAAFIAVVFLSIPAIVLSVFGIYKIISSIF